MLHEAWVYWTRSLRGPTIHLSTTKMLTQLDNHLKLCEPIKLKDNELGMTLAELAKIYPAPPVPEN